MAFLIGHKSGGFTLRVGVNTDDYLKGKSEAHKDALGRASNDPKAEAGPWTLPDRLKAVGEYLNALEARTTWSLFNPGPRNRAIFSVSEKGLGDIGAGGRGGLHPVTAETLATQGSGHIWACVEEYAKPGKRFDESIAHGILYVPVLSHHSTSKELRGG